MIQNLPDWILPNMKPSFNDLESATAIEMVYKLYGKNQELITDYRKFVEDIKNEVKAFKTSTNQDMECFKKKIIKICNDYIKTMDMKITCQDGKISDAIKYMKDNLVQSIHELNKNHKLDIMIVEAISNVEKELTQKQDDLNKELNKKQDDLNTNLQQKYELLNSRVNNLTNLEEGSTTGDAELQDIRTAYDSRVYSTAGESVRKQSSNINHKCEVICELLGIENVIPLDNSKWEQGTISGITRGDSIIRLRTIEPIQVKEGKTYKLFYLNDYFDIAINGYAKNPPESVSENHTYLTEDKEFTFKSFTRYVDFLIRNRATNGKTLTTDEISKLDILMVCVDDLPKSKLQLIDGLFTDVTSLIQSSEERKIKVMSYNTGKFSYGVNPPGVPANEANEKLIKWKRFFGKENVDLLAMQEANNGFDVDFTINANTELFDPIYPNYFNQDTAHISWNGLATRSKYPLTDSELIYISENNTEAKRPILKSYLNVAGKKVCVINCHLVPEAVLTDPSQAHSIRASQMQEIINLVNEEEYVIILGDFNVSGGINELAPFINAGYKLANGGFFGSIRTFNFSKNYTESADKTQDRIIDNIIVSNNIRIDNMEVLEYAYENNTSDHLPIIAELTLL